MTFTDFILLITIILLILISGFLSGSETAITAASKARIIARIKKKDSGNIYLKKIINAKETVISSLLLSNNLVNILASSLATAFFYNIFGVTGIFYATILMTFLLVLFAEVLPKTYSINKPTRTVILIAPIIYYLNKILFPLVFFINYLVNLILDKKKYTNANIEDQQSEEELLGVIDLYKTSNPDYEHEKEMLQSILTLNDTTVEEVLTHRRNIYSINVNLDLKKIIKEINKSKFTRIPFWENNPENIIGLLDIRTLNIDFNKEIDNKQTILERLKKPWFIPETTNLLDQLVSFKQKKEHLSFVIDEYGELLGLITLEDIIEEIVGEIIDEIDTPQIEYKINSKGKIISEGAQEIKDLYKKFDLDPPSSNVSTLGGYVMELAKKIPLYGETISDEFFSYKVLSHSRKQILRLEITKLSK
jgi:Mg2+/Co2+ transporter CorB